MVRFVPRCGGCGEVADYDEEFNHIQGPVLQESNGEIRCEGSCMDEYIRDVMNPRELSEYRIEQYEVEE